MSKLCNATCPKCGKKIGRHDLNREKVQVGQGSDGQGSFKTQHKNC